MVCATTVPTYTLPIPSELSVKTYKFISRHQLLEVKCSHRCDAQPYAACPSWSVGDDYIILLIIETFHNLGEILMEAESLLILNGNDDIILLTDLE